MQTCFVAIRISERSRVIYTNGANGRLKLGSTFTSTMHAWMNMKKRRGYLIYVGRKRRRISLSCSRDVTLGRHVVVCFPFCMSAVSFGPQREDVRRPSLSPVAGHRICWTSLSFEDSHSLHFGRLEFALITSLPFGTVNFGLYTSSELKFRNRVFPHKLGLSVTNLHVIGVIEDEETFRKLCDQDSTRLCLILALEVIFMGRLLTCLVDDTLFRMVENLEDLNCFPWGEHIWTHLYDKIKNVIKNHSDEHYFEMKKDRMYVPTYTLSGFVFAFQVLARERNEEYGVLQFNEEFSSLGHELRLCLEDEERMRLEQEKNIIEEQRFRVEEAKMMSKRNHVDIVPGKTNPTVSWVKINKHRQNVNDPSLLDLLKKVKPWVEDLSRLFHSLDTVWLTPDIKRFISQQGQVKCKISWSDDYTVGQNFWLTLACLDPSRKGWLSEEHIDLWVDYMWHGRPDNANWAMVSCYFVQERLPAILVGAKVFDKKGIDPTDYCIRFKLANSVPKQGGIFGDCGVWVCIFLYRLTHGLSLDVEDPFDVALAYREKMVQILGLLLPEEGNTFYNSRVLVMLCFIDYLSPRTQTCMDFPHNLQKSHGNAIVPIYLSIHHHSPHHGQVGRVGCFK
ncbi:phospholipase-like protein [Tanacetum coccineum]